MTRKILFEVTQYFDNGDGTETCCIDSLVLEHEAHVFIPPNAEALQGLGKGHGGRSNGRQTELWQEPYANTQDKAPSAQSPSARSPTKEEASRCVDADDEKSFGSPTLERLDPQVRPTTTTMDYGSNRPSTSAKQPVAPSSQTSPSTVPSRRTREVTPSGSVPWWEESIFSDESSETASSVELPPQQELKRPSRRQHSSQRVSSSPEQKTHRSKISRVGARSGPKQGSSFAKTTRQRASRR